MCELCFVCSSVCLTVYLSICLSVQNLTCATLPTTAQCTDITMGGCKCKLFVCLYVCLSFCLSVLNLTCISLPSTAQCRGIRMGGCMYKLLVCLIVFLFICLSIFLPICIFVYLFKIWPALPFSVYQPFCLSGRSVLFSKEMLNTKQSNNNELFYEVLFFPRI
jgi:hypothetical protein